MKSNILIYFLITLFVISLYSCKKETVSISENQTVLTEPKEVEKILMKSGFKKLEKPFLAQQRRSLTESEINKILGFVYDPLVEPEIEEHASMSSPETVLYLNQYHFLGLEGRGIPSIFQFTVEPGTYMFSVTSSDLRYSTIGASLPTGSFLYHHISGEAYSANYALAFGTLIEVIETAETTYYRQFQVKFGCGSLGAYIKLTFIF